MARKPRRPKFANWREVHTYLISVQSQLEQLQIVDVVPFAPERFYRAIGSANSAIEKPKHVADEELRKGLQIRRDAMLRAQRKQGIPELPGRLPKDLLPAPGKYWRRPQQRKKPTQSGGSTR